MGARLSLHTLIQQRRNKPTLNDKIQALSIEENFKMGIEDDDSKKLEQQKLEQQGMGATPSPN